MHCNSVELALVQFNSILRVSAGFLMAASSFGKLNGGGFRWDHKTTILRTCLLDLLEYYNYSRIRRLVIQWILKPYQTHMTPQRLLNISCFQAEHFNIQTHTICILPLHKNSTHFCRLQQDDHAGNVNPTASLELIQQLIRCSCNFQKSSLAYKRRYKGGC